MKEEMTPNATTYVQSTQFGLTAEKKMKVGAISHKIHTDRKIHRMLRPNNKFFLLLLIGLVTQMIYSQAVHAKEEVPEDMTAMASNVSEVPPVQIIWASQSIASNFGLDSLYCL